MAASPSSNLPAPDAAGLRLELEQAHALLAEERADRQEFDAALGEAVEHERRRLAQSLHDTVCQTLTAAYFSAKFLEQKWQKKSPAVAGEVGDLCEMIHTVVGELREITRGLRLGEAGDIAPPK